MLMISSLKNRGKSLSRLSYLRHIIQHTPYIGINALTKLTTLCYKAKQSHSLSKPSPTGNWEFLEILGTDCLRALAPPTAQGTGNSGKI